MRRALLLALPLAVALHLPGSALAAGPPTVPAAWVTGVTATSAVLRAEIDPQGLDTRYRFEYLSRAAYEANLAASSEAFAGAIRVPAGEADVGAGTGPVDVFFLLGGANRLLADTGYAYRPVATNEAGTATTPAHFLHTESVGASGGLPDGRTWELVSPVDKNGGAVAAPSALFGGGDIQAAAGGGALTYGSATAFAEPAAAPPVSQYLSRRGPGGWSTENLSQPFAAGGYGDHPDGAPFRLFSEDLGRALLLNPRFCEPAEPCPRSYSLRESATGALTPLPAQAAGMRVLGASPDLGRVLFESEGQTYEWSGGGLVPVNLVPPSGGPGAVFQAQSADGDTVVYTESGHLYRYDATSEAATDLTPAGGVVGVLALSADGARVYYQDASGLRLWHGGSVHQIAPGAAATVASDYPPATATARLSADGTALAFLSAGSLGGFDNLDANTGAPDVEVYRYDSVADSLLCVSCNPTGERPAGPASIPGALVNGSTIAYRARALSADGRRLFFDSGDSLVTADTDSSPDVYQWEAPGEGSCAEAPGCVALISGGRAEGGRFLDASADGADVFFLTGDSLLGADPGSIDAYDARVGGGLPEPEATTPCVADACQPLPSPPEDPAAGTAAPASGNPPPRYAKEAPRRHRCPKGKRKVRRHGKVRCVRKRSRGAR